VEFGRVVCGMSKVRAEGWHWGRDCPFFTDESGRVMERWDCLRRMEMEIKAVGLRLDDTSCQGCIIPREFCEGWQRDKGGQWVKSGSS